MLCSGKKAKPPWPVLPAGGNYTARFAERQGIANLVSKKFLRKQKKLKNKCSILSFSNEIDTKFKNICWIISFKFIKSLKKFHCGLIIKIFTLIFRTI